MELKSNSDKLQITFYIYMYIYMLNHKEYKYIYGYYNRTAQRDVYFLIRLDDYFIIMLCGPFSHKLHICVPCLV